MHATEPAGTLRGRHRGRHRPPTTAPRRTQDARTLADAYNASALILFKELSGASQYRALALFDRDRDGDGAQRRPRETEREMAGVLGNGSTAPPWRGRTRPSRSEFNGYDKSAVPPRCPAGLQPLRQPLRSRAAGRWRMRVPGPARRRALHVARVACALRPGHDRECPDADQARRSGRRRLCEPARGPIWCRAVPDASLDDVNGWVARKTEGKIDRILDRLDPAGAAVILNAVYFKAKWAAVFSKAATKSDAFNLSRRRRSPCP